MITNEPLISINGLIHRFGDTEILNIKKWQLEDGQHHLLLGPSGSGKTTFLSILTGLLRPSEGEVTLSLEPALRLSIADIPAHIARIFGIVFQDHHLMTSLTLEENLKLAQQLSTGGVDNEWSGHLLERLGLYARRTDKPAAFSRGELQRAAIARAVATRPKILIADEPTSALDDDNCEQVMRLLQSLAEESEATLLIASHDNRIMPYFKARLVLPARARGTTP